MSDYTVEDLKGMTRTQLRQAGIKVLQIDNKEICEFGTQEIIDKILAEQEGGNGKSTGTSTKSRAAVGRGRGKAEEPKEETRKATSSEKKGGSGEDLSSRVDAVGATLDENHNKVMDVLGSLHDMLVEIQRMQSALFGLVTDLYKFTGEPGDLKDRLAELDDEWEKQGNA